MFFEVETVQLRTTCQSLSKNRQPVGSQPVRCQIKIILHNSKFGDDNSMWIKCRKLKK